MAKEQEEIKTRELMDFLSQKDSLAEVLKLIDHNAVPMTLAEYLNLLIEKRGMTTAQLICSTNLSKSFVYQLLNGSRLAGRDPILKIALALGLSVDETQRLLTVSGNSVLYPKVKRDAVIIFCLNKRLPLAKAYELLVELSLTPLDIGGE